MSDDQKIKILICDDHPIMRFGIAAIIQSQPNMTVAGQAPPKKRYACFGNIGPTSR
jgi:DNA-binding NarL/FixJ family response regulator